MSAFYDIEVPYLSIMEYEYENENGGCLRGVFRSFVCVALSLLLSLHVYAYFWAPARDPLDGDFADIRYVVTQLTRGLTEVRILSAATQFPSGSKYKMTLLKIRLGLGSAVIGKIALKPTKYS